MLSCWGWLDTLRAKWVCGESWHGEVLVHTSPVFPYQVAACDLERDTCPSMSMQSPLQHLPSIAGSAHACVKRYVARPTPVTRWYLGLLSRESLKCRGLLPCTPVQSDDSAEHSRRHPLLGEHPTIQLLKPAEEVIGFDAAAQRTMKAGNQDDDSFMDWWFSPARHRPPEVSCTSLSAAMTHLLRTGIASLKRAHVVVMWRLWLALIAWWVTCAMIAQW